MEGLIPFVYRAIMQYKHEKEIPSALGSYWFNESPSASYMRLPGGDSGRFQTSDHIQLLCSSDHQYRFSASTSSPSSSSRAPSSTTQIIVSSGVQSPVLRRLAARRVASSSSS
ncbi:uncharacterized protein LOC121267606 [Juglans microcarpa x Juglans regia]|uniref:uncharacterized protein LOC121267606 n=1 Tax=Juglans microcarpa x Juglans regia TaxID=2249226 RepID=UPI001B7E926B|nr:uncharacterized protein LOC121267606 [Juglans microcarpa x Juglans regia]